VVLRVSGSAEGAPHATIDIPDEGSKRLVAESLMFDGARLRFGMNTAAATG